MTVAHLNSTLTNEDHSPDMNYIGAEYLHQDSRWIMFQKKWLLAIKRIKRLSIDVEQLFSSGTSGFHTGRCNSCFVWKSQLSRRGCTQRRTVVCFTVGCLCCCAVIKKAFFYVFIFYTGMVVWSFFMADGTTEGLRLYKTFFSLPETWCWLQVARCHLDLIPEKKIIRGRMILLHKYIIL